MSIWKEHRWIVTLFVSVLYTVLIMFCVISLRIRILVSIDRSVYGSQLIQAIFGYATVYE